MVKDPHLQVQCHTQLFHYFKWFNNRAATAYHPVVQKEVDWLSAKDVIEFHQQVVLVFTQMCLWFLSVLVVYNIYSILSNSVTTYTHILLRWLLSDRYSSLFNKVMVDSLWISVMLICIFLMLSITIIFYFLFGNINLIGGGLCHLAQPWPQWSSLH